MGSSSATKSKQLSDILKGIIQDSAVYDRALDAATKIASEPNDMEVMAYVLAEAIKMIRELQTKVGVLEGRVRQLDNRTFGLVKF